MPDGYEEAHLCRVLKLTYTELVKQPFDWVVKMMEYIEAENKVKEIENKKQQMKNKSGGVKNTHLRKNRRH